MTYTAAEVRKFIAAAAGAAVSIATQVLAMGDVVPPEVANWLTVIVSIGTAVGVFGVPNTNKKVDDSDEDTKPVLDSEEATVPTTKRRRPVI